MRTNTTLATIFKQIKSHLITLGLFNSSTVYLGVEPEAANLEPSTTYAVITPGRQRVINSEVDGPMVAGTFDVSVLSYVNLDYAEQQDIALTDPTAGIWAVTDSIMGGLHLYDLTDGSSNQILACPIHFNDIGELEDKDDNWKRVTLTFDIVYGYNIANTPVIGTRTTTTLATIFSQLKARIIDLGLYNSATVYLGVAPVVESLQPSVSYGVITPGRQRVIDPETIEPTIEGSFRITLLKYVNLDYACQQDIALADAAFGIWADMDLVTAGLHLYDLVDPISFEPILACPIHFSDLSQLDDDENWKKLTATFDIAYGYGLTVVDDGAFSDAFSDAFDI